MGYVDLNTNKKTDWCTPPKCRDLLVQFGRLKLDACTSAHNWMQAEQFYTTETNGFVQSWECGQPGDGSAGRALCWCNFEWSRDTSGKWVLRACGQGEKMRPRPRGS